MKKRCNRAHNSFRGFHSKDLAKHGFPPTYKREGKLKSLEERGIIYDKGIN